MPFSVIIFTSVIVYPIYKNIFDCVKLKWYSVNKNTNTLKGCVKLKKVLKIIFAVVGALAVITLIAFSPYIASFIFTEDDYKVKNDYEMVFTVSSVSEKTDDNGNYIIDKPLTLYFQDAKFKLFNYYGINYTADCYVKATLTYQQGLKE